MAEREKPPEQETPDTGIIDAQIAATATARRAETQRQQAEAHKAEEEHTAAEERAHAEEQRQHQARADVQRQRQATAQAAPAPVTPAVQPLRCRCGSVTFAVPQTVALLRDGELMSATPVPPPDDLTYTCLGCGDTGNLAYMKGRLNG